MKNENECGNVDSKGKGKYFEITLKSNGQEKTHIFQIPTRLIYAFAGITVAVVVALCVSVYTTGKALTELRQTNEAVAKGKILNSQLKEKMQQLDSRLIEEKEKATDNQEKFDQALEEQQSNYLERLEYYKSRASEIEEMLNTLQELKRDIESSLTKSSTDAEGNMTLLNAATAAAYLSVAGITEDGQAALLEAASEQDLNNTYNFLDTQIKKEIEDYNRIINEVNDLKVLMSIQPSSWPVRGVVTSEQGERSDPITDVLTTHSGIDIAVPVGTPVRVTFDGTVAFAGERESYGMLVIVDHGNGKHTYYGHNSELLVSYGEKVVRGQVIAKSGDTGRSTGPHVHYEVRVYGVIRNPRDYMK